MSKIEADIIRARGAAIEIPMTYVVRGIAKSWGEATSTGVLTTASLNVASIVDSGVGEVRFNMSAFFVNANRAVGLTPRVGGAVRISSVSGYSVGYAEGQCWSTSQALTDPAAWAMMQYGDLA